MIPLAQTSSSDPLILADGTVIDVHTGKKARPQYLEVPSNAEAIKVIQSTRKKLEDLPDVPERMNIVSTILSYHLFGLVDDEISIALNLPIERVVAIKMLEAFTKMQQTVMDNMIQQDKGEVQAVLEQAAVTGANTIVHLMQYADDEKIQLTAAKDVLDRNGHRPADILEVRHSMQNSLTIEHIIRSDDDVAPIIEINDFTEVDDNGDCS